MKRRIRRGFTLVELLVVISIIGMLAALILPAVNSAREAARRNTCMSNMRQVGMAVIGHETNKGYYPGYKNVQAVRSHGMITDANGNIVLDSSPLPDPYAQSTSWVFPLLSFMERNDIVQNYGEGAEDIGGTRRGVTPDLTLSVMICPSDFRSGLEGRGASSFVANGGFEDLHNGNFGSNYTAFELDVDEPSYAVDHPQNGVFQNYYPGTLGYNDGNDPGDPLKTVRTSSSAINDGVSTTLLLSENIDGGLWYDTHEFQNCFTWKPADGPAWSSPKMTPTLFTTQRTGMNEEGVYRINEEAGNIDLLGSGDYPDNPYAFARPSSAHPGGVNTVFCDGHAQFIQEGIDLLVWSQLMSPYGERTRFAGKDGSAEPLKGLAGYDLFATSVLDEDALANQ